jgi:ABC-2 type transport system permease protein
MPHALRVFAENQPLTHVIDTMRAWLVGTPLDNSGWLAFVWCLGLLAVSIPLTAWMFRRRAVK